MHNLLPVLRREFPEFEAVCAYEAGIPVYFIRLEVDMLAPQEFTLFEDYFLRAVSLKVDTLASIAKLYGVEERDLIPAGADLLKKGFIEQNNLIAERGRTIQLTDRGHAFLKNSIVPPTPKRKTFRLHFNALTWASIPLVDQPWFGDMMAKEGLPILPLSRREHPTLGDFNEKDVTAALSGASGFSGTLVSIIKLRRVELQYIAPVTVILLRHQNTTEQRIGIYRNSVQLREESLILQRRYETGAYKLPSDVSPMGISSDLPPLPLPEDVRETIRALTESEMALTRLQSELVVEKEKQSSTQDDQERALLSQKVQELQVELSRQLEANQLLQSKLDQNKVMFLRTEDHRSYLIQALKEAQEEIIIISPWMTRRACNDELCQLVAKATHRGVRVRIGYGFGRERNAEEAERSRFNVQMVKNALLRMKPVSNKLDVIETSGTHQKILICDKRFAITGSFNWLSYAGEKDDGYRNELGTLFYTQEQVQAITGIANRVLNIDTNKPRP